MEQETVLPLPFNLEANALNVDVLQEALDNVEQFQAEARTKLFKALAYHAIQPSTPALDAALSALCSSAAHLLPDTPEYQLAQYAQQYRSITDSACQMTKDLAQQQAESDLGEQFAEFKAYLHHGQLVEASWCLVRLRKTLHEAKQQHHALHQRVQGAAEDAAAQDEAVGAAQAAASVADTLEQHCQQSDEQMKQILDEGCKAIVQLLNHQSHSDTKPVSPPSHARSNGSSPSEGNRGAARMHSIVALPAGLLRPGFEGVAAVKVTELWGSASVRGELQQRIISLSDLLIHGVLTPLLRGEALLQVKVLAPEEGVPAPHDSQPGADGQDSGPSLTHRSSVSEQSASRGGCKLIWEPRPPQQAPPSVENACLTVLKLLANVVFDVDEGLLKSFGEVFWPSFAEAYVEHHAQPLVEASVDDGGAVDGLIDAASGLEDWAESCGLLEEPYLVPAVEAAVGRVLGASQAKHLDSARRLLLEGLDPQHAGDAVQVGEPVPADLAFYHRLLQGHCPTWELQDPPNGVLTDGPLLAKGPYKVAPGMLQLVSLAESVLQEAATSGNRVAARALVGCVHKFALLARELPSALTPSDAASLCGVPLLGLVHHNSLLHLADSMLLMQASYAASLEALTEEPLGFVREALLLRHAAQLVLEEQVSQQLQHLHELLAGMQGLRWVGLSGTAQAGIASRRAVAQVVHSLGRWGRTLINTLPPETLVQVCSQCLAGLCSSLVGDVMAKSDIGIDDCRELRDILGTLVADVLPALIPATPSKQHGEPHEQLISGVPVQLLRDAVATACRPMRKLRMLLDVLDSPMKQIVSMWERQEMQAVGFDVKEVEHLLTALFEQSNHMRTAIARVRAAAR